MTKTQIPQSLKYKILDLYIKGQEYKQQWDNLTVRKIADKWETTPDTIQSIASGRSKPTGQTLIEDSDVPIIRELLRDAHKARKAYEAHSPKAISELTGIPVGTIKNIVRRK